MPRVEGRGIREPTVAEVFVGQDLLLRIDDDTRPEFWLTMALGPEELGAMVRRYREWLSHTDEDAALAAFDNSAQVNQD